MIKLIEYNFKNTYQFLFRMFAIAISLIMGMFIYGRLVPNKILESFFGKALIFLFPTIISVVLLTVLIYIVMDFTKVQYNKEEIINSHYMSGYKMLLSKLIVAMVWYLIYKITYYIFEGICFIYLYKTYTFSEIIELFVESGNITWQIIFVYIFTNLLFAMLFLLMAYFCMSLGKENIDKKLGIDWIKGYFLIWILYLIGLYIIEIYPNVRDFSELGLKGFNMKLYGIGYKIRLGKRYLSFFSIGINKVIGEGIVSLNLYIYIIIINILFFLGTGRILNNKIKLKNDKNIYY